MNRLPNQAVDYMRELIPLVANLNCDLVVMPPVVCCERLAPLVSATNVSLGAQNVHYLESGPYTGELSASMLAAVGVEYVLIGHSERRALFNETDKSVNLKVRAVLEAGLMPVVCVGDSRHERDQGDAKKCISSQVLLSLVGLSSEQAERVVIAYEPIWAVGRELKPDPCAANEILAMIREVLRRTFGEAASHQVRLLYGGSVRPNNAASLLDQPHVDGLLVGAATADVQDFAAVAEATDKNIRN